MKQLIDISGDFSFYLLLAFLFLVNISIAGCYLVSTLLLIQFIIFIIAALKIRINRAKTKPMLQWPQLPKFYKYFLLYILFSFIATLFSIDRLNSLKDNKEFFVFLLVPIFLLIINSKKRLEYSLFTVLASTVISALVGIAVTLKEGITLDHRLRGLTSHWMTYSGLLMLVFIFFFVYLFYEKRKKIKIVILISLMIILTSILLSLTRSMWVGIFVSLGIFIIYYKPKILYLALPALVILILVLPGSVKSRIASTFDMSNATNKDRLYMVTTGINIFKDHPLTGVGPDNIKKIYDRYKPAEADQTNPHLHNNFLHVLAERGILALLSLLAAFVSITIQLIKKIKNSIDFEKVISVGVLFVFIGFLVAGMFEYNLGDSEIKFLLFYFLSIPFIKYSMENGSWIMKRGVQ
ncbi:MAG: O-antigen ligase family protein [Candidatus Aminicenantes bacterium]|nr:MAG: O-antigen ligase family protein [Candidatus Aminicenantes bacterium]